MNTFSRRIVIPESLLALVSAAALAHPCLRPHPLQEAAMLRQLQHRNVVGFAGVSTSGNVGAILMVSGRDTGSDVAQGRVLAELPRERQITVTVWIHCGKYAFPDVLCTVCTLLCRSSWRVGTCAHGWGRWTRWAGVSFTGTATARKWRRTLRTRSNICTRGASPTLVSAKSGLL